MAKFITSSLEKEFAKYPFYSQDGKGANAKILCKFFFGCYTWYVLEAHKFDDGTYNFYGIVENNGVKEYGYFMQDELQSLRYFGYPCVERDLYFRPCAVSALGKIGY